eukprot:RCo023851
MPFVQAVSVTPCVGRGEDLFTIQGTVQRARSLSTARRGSTVILEDSPVRRQSRKLRVPLRLVIVVSMCVFTVGPAVALWVASWQTGNRGIETIRGIGESSVQAVTVEFRSSTLRSTRSAFMELVQPSEDLARTQAYRLLGMGFGALSASEAVQNYSAILERLGLHYDLRSRDNLALVRYGLLLRATASFPQSTNLAVYQYSSFPRMNLDVLRKTHDPTIYVSEVFPTSSLNASWLTVYYVEQDTGVRLADIYHSEIPLSTSSSDVSTPEFYSWENELFFNPYTGLSILRLDYGVPLTDQQAAHRLALHTSVYRISSHLRDILRGPTQRLFVSFRTPAGTLVGASHGKVFSHSDVDYSANDPLFNPPPVEQFRRYTPVNSTDASIRAAGEWLLGTFFAWDAIPHLETVQFLNGENYWLSCEPIETEMGLRMNLVLLVDQASVLGRIEANTAATFSDISATNRALVAALVVVVVSALALAAAISWLLTVSLSRLAFGMDMLSL